ncbi:MAG: LysR family transcriptional regulator [Rhodospirillales bacterium]|nr:LysR family transcriptional regulator [Rhodospirillales bacterium]
MNLNNLTLFLRIVEKGSLAAAGRELGLSATTVSERLAVLEAYYGVTLLNRTTRAISLTEEGRTLLDGARLVLSEAEELDSRVRLGAETLSGPIRVSATIDLGRTTIQPVIDEFIAENPQITIELLLADGYINIVDEGIDIAVRFGTLNDSTLRARTLSENHRVVCASPDYIERYGTPVKPSDLEKHNCLLMRFGRELDNVWNFCDGVKDVQVSVTGNRIANDGRLVHDWCIEGHGIALKSLWDVGADIQTGNLVRLLEEYSPPPSSIQMLFPPSRTQPRRVRELAKKLVEAFER